MPTSLCSSLVNLGDAAELDDATSKLFFSDTSAAGPVLSWPVASEITSTLTSQDWLVALCGNQKVPIELRPVCANHLGLGWRACTPPPMGSNMMCVYSAALDAGLRFPLHAFYIRVLRHYRLAPSQLTPNAWSYLAAFVLLCEDADVEPLVSAFRFFFSLCAHRHQGKPTGYGYHHFQPFRRLFAGSDLPPWSGWKSKFFFLECPSGWKCPVKWGRPKRGDARRVQLTCTVIEKLKNKGCNDVKAFLTNRQLPVGDQAPLQSELKAEVGAAGASASAVGAAAESASTRKRSRLSPAAVLSQPQPLPSPAVVLSQSQPPPTGFAPIRVSSTGGSSGHIPPPGLAPIRASSTGGRSGHIPPPQQQSFGESTPAPLELRGMRARAQAVRIGGSSEVTPPAPHTMCASDALQLWEAITKANEQAAMIEKLNQELHLVKAWNGQWQKELSAAGAKHASEIAELIARVSAANDRNNHLNEELGRYVADRVQLICHLRTASVEVAQLKEEQAAGIARLNEEHAAEKAQLKEELAAENAQLKEELMADAKQLHRESYAMGVRDMMQLTLTLYENVVSQDKLKLEAEVLLDVEEGDALLR